MGLRIQVSILQIHGLVHVLSWNWTEHITSCTLV